jgi:hypothetical protein
MQIYTKSTKSQFLSEVPSTANRKAGVEIVISASIGKRFYFGPRPGRRLGLLNDDESWAQRVRRASKSERATV